MKNTNGKIVKTVYRTNLRGVPIAVRPAILAQIAREEGIEVSQIIVEG